MHQERHWTAMNIRSHDGRNNEHSNEDIHEVAFADNESRETRYADRLNVTQLARSKIVKRKQRILPYRFKEAADRLKIRVTASDHRRRDVSLPLDHARLIALARRYYIGFVDDNFRWARFQRLSYLVSEERSWQRKRKKEKKKERSITLEGFSKRRNADQG